MATKTCNKCKATKEANLINFTAEKRVASGLSSWCRDCVNKKSKEIRHKNAAAKKSKKIIEPVIEDVEYKHAAEKDIPVVRLPKISLFKGRSYSIQVPKQGKGTDARLIKGKVIQETDKLVFIQTKNYVESFSKWELSKYKVMEV